MVFSIIEVVQRSVNRYKNILSNIPASFKFINISLNLILLTTLILSHGIHNPIINSIGVYYSIIFS